MRKRSGQEGSTPVASLIDVVFLLIIFFVVTAAKEKEIIDRSIQLAQAKYAEAAQERPPNQITINVDEDGDMNISKSPITMSVLGKILRSHFDAGERRLPIVIRADAQTEYRHVDRIQTVIKEHGFYEVRLAAEAKE